MTAWSPPPLYAIVDATVTEQRGWTVPALAAAFLDGGATLLQLRAAARPTATYVAWAEEIVARAASYRAAVVINDRADVARLVHAAGVHVGQDDLLPRLARMMVGPDRLVGVSTHASDQLDDAVADGIVDYVAVGPVYGTQTKQTGYAPVGLEAIRAAAARDASGPVVAIGGIVLARAPDVLAAGAASVAVIGDLLRGGNPTRRVRAYLDRLEK